MQVFMRATSALLFAILLASPASASSRPAHAHRKAPHEAARPEIGMYSRRARRRAALILQLELLEMRKARLERVRAALQKRIPIDELLKE